jgi:hypothetical protein
LLELRLTLHDSPTGEFFCAFNSERISHMNQRDLNRAVAKATGETVTTISEMGFIPLTPHLLPREPRFLDWDQLDRERNVAVSRSRQAVPALH